MIVVELALDVAFPVTTVPPAPAVFTPVFEDAFVFEVEVPLFEICAVVDPPGFPGPVPGPSFPELPPPGGGGSSPFPTPLLPQLP